MATKMNHSGEEAHPYTLNSSRKPSAGDAPSQRTLLTTDLLSGTDSISPGNLAALPKRMTASVAKLIPLVWTGLPKQIQVRHTATLTRAEKRVGSPYSFVSLTQNQADSVVYFCTVTTVEIKSVSHGSLCSGENALCVYLRFHFPHPPPSTNRH